MIEKIDRYSLNARPIPNAENWPAKYGCALIFYSQ